MSDSEKAQEPQEQPPIVLIRSIYLTSRHVLTVGDPFPEPDGSPTPPIEVEGQSLELRIGSIFEVPKERVTVEEDGAEITEVRGGTYEVYSDQPISLVPFLEIPENRVVWVKKTIPYEHAIARMEQFAQNALLDPLGEPEPETPAATEIPEPPAEVEPEPKPEAVSAQP